MDNGACRVDGYMYSTWRVRKCVNLVRASVFGVAHDVVIQSRASVFGVAHGVTVDCMQSEVASALLASSCFYIY